MSGIIGTRVLPAGRPEPNIGGNHGSRNSAVALRSSNSDHHSSRTLPSLDRRGNRPEAPSPAYHHRHDRPPTFQRRARHDDLAAAWNETAAQIDALIHVIGGPYQVD